VRGDLAGDVTQTPAAVSKDSYRYMLRASGWYYIRALPVTPAVPDTGVVLDMMTLIDSGLNVGI